jgi:hypothetical protein
MAYKAERLPDEANPGNFGEKNRKYEKNTI